LFPPETGLLPAKQYTGTTRPCQWGSHVARLNFKTSRVGVYKCLSLIVGFAITIAVWPREVVSCCDFILRAVATFGHVACRNLPWHGRSTTGVSSLAFGPKSVDNKRGFVLYCINTSQLGVSEITTHFYVEWFTHFC